MFGLSDGGAHCGVLVDASAPGYKADFNLIDYDGLRLLRPEMAYDLPAGGKRLVQRAEGYRMTIKGGEATGVLPGRLIRGARGGPGAVAG